LLFKPSPLAPDLQTKAIIHRTRLCNSPQAAMAGYEHEAPFDSGMLPVSSIHQLYYEQYGKKNGKPGTSRLPIELERI
jgi:hypothetical protein